MSPRKSILHAGLKEENGVYKVMVCKTVLGTYYVQEMPGLWGVGKRFVIMKDRQRYQNRDYENSDAACAAMLEAVRRDVLKQTTLQL